MGDAVRIRTNAGDADYRVAVAHLESAAWHAQNIGFTLPTEVTAALMILRGEACITYFSNASVSPVIMCVGRPETDEDFDEHMEMVAFVCERLKKRRHRAIAKASESNVIGFTWPTANA